MGLKKATVEEARCASLFWKKPEINQRAPNRSMSFTISTSKEHLSSIPSATRRSKHIASQRYPHLPAQKTKETQAFRGPTWSACPCSSELRTSSSVCGSTLSRTAPPAACGCFATMLTHSDSADAAICRSESLTRPDSSPTIVSMLGASNWAL